MSLDEALARRVAPRRFGLALLAGFAVVAFVLTLSASMASRPTRWASASPSSACASRSAPRAGASWGSSSATCSGRSCWRRDRARPRLRRHARPRRAPVPGRSHRPRSRSRWSHCCSCSRPRWRRSARRCAPRASTRSRRCAGSSELRRPGTAPTTTCRPSRRLSARSRCPLAGAAQRVVQRVVERQQRARLGLERGRRLGTQQALLVLLLRLVRRQ